MTVAEPRERSRLPVRVSAADALPQGLWTSAGEIRRLWQEVGTVHADERFVTDARMLLRRDEIRGIPPRWLTESPTDRDPVDPARLEEQWQTFLAGRSVYLTDHEVGNVAGQGAVAYPLPDGTRVYLRASRLWLASAATGARELYATGDASAPVVVQRGAVPTAAIMPLRAHGGFDEDRFAVHVCRRGL